MEQSFNIVSLPEYFLHPSILPETLQEIMKFLNIQDILRLMRTSRSLFKVIISDEFIPFWGVYTCLSLNQSEYRVINNKYVKSLCDLNESNTSNHRPIADANPSTQSELTSAAYRGGLIYTNGYSRFLIDRMLRFIASKGSFYYRLWNRIAGLAIVESSTIYSLHIEYTMEDFLYNRRYACDTMDSLNLEYHYTFTYESWSLFKGMMAYVSHLTDVYKLKFAFDDEYKFPRKLSDSDLSPIIMMFPKITGNSGCESINYLSRLFTKVVRPEKWLWLLNYINEIEWTLRWRYEEWYCIRQFLFRCLNLYIRDKHQVDADLVSFIRDHCVSLEYFCIVAKDIPIELYNNIWNDCKVDVNNFNTIQLCITFVLEPWTIDPIDWMKSIEWLFCYWGNAEFVKYTIDTARRHEKHLWVDTFRKLISNTQISMPLCDLEDIFRSIGVKWVVFDLF